MSAEELVSCPFNPAHRVSRIRFHTHIDKCKKQTANMNDFAQCSFSIFHYVLKDKLKEHEQTCPQRSVVDNQIFAGPASFVTAALSTNEAKVNCNESWDDITPAAFFKPDERRENAPYMVLPEGLTKSKRKMHRNNERDRLRDQEHSKKRVPEEPVKQPTPNETQIRKPTGLSKLTGSRIAAKFSVPVKAESPSGVQNTTPSAPSIGRGRGALLGMNKDGQETDLGTGFRYEDFPKLGK